VFMMRCFEELCVGCELRNYDSLCRLLYREIGEENARDMT